jgi:hypothetical protein
MAVGKQVNPSLCSTATAANTTLAGIDPLACCSGVSKRVAKFFQQCSTADPVLSLQMEKKTRRREAAGFSGNCCLVYSAGLSFLYILLPGGTCCRCWRMQLDSARFSDRVLPGSTCCRCWRMQLDSARFSHMLLAGGTCCRCWRMQPGDFCWSLSD